ncbi:hypothetical protein [Glycomyces albidus]|uniref:Uncharacterized protein n=1 Tax=Glycomyces albidus TaxID=2656774 RepID=A0A6L5GF23_9ACTN|nr:hypothetical protein [Glycomyces albidus]MQM28302.1 hypothetical protein [Glycomyces albidus]
MAQPATQPGTVKSEVLGEWLTDNGNQLTLLARPGTGYASVWLSNHGQPVKIGCALYAGGVVREVRWEGLWTEQTDAWKSQQRSHITALIAARHAGQPLAVLSWEVVNTSLAEPGGNGARAFWFGVCRYNVTPIREGPL